MTRLRLARPPFFAALSAVLALFSFPPAGSAQEAAADAQPAPGFVDARAIPRAAATGSPMVGEVVVAENGEVSSAYFQKLETCNVRGCRVFIFDSRTGALINNDGVWAPAYAPTGVGREVIRVRAFSDAERPRAQAPSDEALRASPRIRVREPSSGQQR